MRRKCWLILIHDLLQPLRYLSGQEANIKQTRRLNALVLAEPYSFVSNSHGMCLSRVTHTITETRVLGKNDLNHT